MSSSRSRIRVVTAIAVAGLLSSCSATALPPEIDLPPLVAHRGASEDAPENTLAAFRLAWEQESDAIEADFRLTADGVIVAHHDDTTERTAGLDRPLEAQTLAELRTLDAGGWKGPAWTGERIPTLTEVLATVPAGRSILIELKIDGRIVPELVRTIEASDLEDDQIVVIAFDAETIAAVNAARSGLRTLWISDFEQVDDGWQPTTETLIATARRVGADGVDVRAEPLVVTGAMVRAVHDAGLELHVWTVNDLDTARRMAALGVDSITTDRPGWMREQLQAE